MKNKQAILEQAKQIQSHLSLCDRLGVREVSADPFIAISAFIAVRQYGRGWRILRRKYRFYFVRIVS